MESIQDMWQRIKTGTMYAVGQWGLALIIVIVAAACFGLGRLSALVENRPELSIREAASVGVPITPGGMFVGAKDGSQYYYPWCSGAEKLVAADEVWFPSAAAAEKAGYTPGKACKGLSS